MSWEAKTDYCGLEIVDKLSAKTANEGRTGQYLEKLGKDGSIKATKAFGTANATPSNDYVIEDDISFTDGQIQLGKVTEVDSKKYALDKVSISTGAGQEPTFNATCVQVEDSATTDATFDVPAFSLSKEEVAQELFGAFTLAGDGNELTACSAEASCTVGLHTANGDPKASSIHTGHIVVNVTIGQYGSNAPTLKAAEGWDVSSPLTCDDPDADLPNWTATLTKPLSKTKNEK